jgi:hypothetical protein
VPLTGKTVSGWFKLATHIMQPFGLVLSLFAAVLVIGLIALFLNRRLYVRFPWFFVYLLSSVAMTAVRLLFRGDYITVFKVYWSTEAVYAVLALLVLHEVFRKVFVAFYLFRWFWLVFPGAVVAIVLITFKGISLAPSGAPGAVRFVLAVGLTTKYVEAGMFVFCLLLALALNVTWRNHTFGIVQGFAVSALGTWIAYSIRSRFGIKFGALATYSPPVAYILAVILWLITFLRPEPPARTETWPPSVTPEQLLEEIRRYTVFLWRFIKKS